MRCLLLLLAMATTSAAPAQDWLLGGHEWKAKVITTQKDLILSNGLLTRRFRLQPAVACISYINESNNEQLIRAVMPEARLVIDGKTIDLGGLTGQKEKAYLREDWIDTLHANGEQATWSTGPIAPPWAGCPWHPKGIELTFTYKEAQVHYALYDDIPLLCKWVTVYNPSKTPIKVNQVINELLATPEEQSAVVGSTAQMTKPHGLYVESNYAFNNAMRYDLSDQTTHWLADSTYTSQVNYNYQTPCLLETYPPMGPNVTLNEGDSLESVRSYELLMDSYDRERRGLAIRKMYRTIAPWTDRNPIFMHLVSHDDAQVYTAIDQCAATGYEAVILSFGSHCNMEDTSAANIAAWKTLADYAHKKGILIGAYSLFSSRHISDTDDVIGPKTGKPGEAFFGYAPCYGSYWGLAYLAKIEYFLSTTGFNLFENDGPYAGDVCASTTHPGHKGLEDSQWEQMLLQKSLYHWCNEHGIYVNAPDWYFLDGTNKIALGYREVNFSLPRDQQLLLNRQNIYDGTWEKTPSMGWGFVPLTRYQGGGPEAVLEPLKDHLKDYAQLMVQYYGAGIQACYRGPRLYDTDSTKELVQMTISWYKKYRTILNADIIHLRRPDGRDWDGILHVDPQGAVKGFVLLYNPLDKPITRAIEVPLYYAGLTTRATVNDKVYDLDRQYRIHLPVTIPANGFVWYAIK